ncbi:tyrosine-type recombinase/integrase [Polynucleobacter sp. UB-Piko-W3]|uniref:tyrosine-type recombinase/integrase n=1 Tax=Polynucleobacter sp. UB-Piko-W3 TaxID=1819735 RepID=UPI001C0E37E3|nr:tyrosine-type recombinase/integrase [Polynucleobacter sp. UB-Piko-W3]MBU3554861.1 tyrosine-type recombinase/integrase [Polynucleobacter sp. UB-Piko-W3]
MGKKRTIKRNIGLLPRWKWVGNVLYYEVPKGQESFWDNKRTFRLGSTLTEAYTEWASRMSGTEVKTDFSTVERLLDAYVMKAVPSLSVTHRTNTLRAIVNLKKSFGHLKPTAIQPVLINQYLTARSVKKKNSEGKMVGGHVVANREIEIFQVAIAWAIGQGAFHRHPFRGEFKFKSEKPRDRYIEDWEIDEMMKVDSHRQKGSFHAIKAYIKIKMLTGMAIGDLLRLTMTDVNKAKDGIFIQRHKTGHKTMYLWSPELLAAVDEAIAARPCLSPFLFCTARGKGFFNEATGRCPGWKSMWQRFVEKVMAETKITEKFTDHDIRAKVGSDKESDEEARKTLSHSTSATTKRHYRRKAEVVHTGTH